MLLLNKTLDDPAANLALDEALLDQLDQGPDQPEVLRFWRQPDNCVVIGRSSRIAEEVKIEACRRDGVPILRRSSGGMAIVAGPGCWMYSVVIDYRRRPAWRAIDRMHAEVLGKFVQALAGQLEGVRIAGTSDIAVEQRKLSGNSLRCKRDAGLYHGTLLYDFPLELLERYLHSPGRQPEYRRQRTHEDFVANARLDIDVLEQRLAEVWQVDGACGTWPRDRVKQLVEQRYGLPSWHWRR